MKKFLIAITMLFSCVGVSNCFANGNGYSASRSIVIDHTKVPNTDQTQFPILVCGNGSASCSQSVSGLATIANGGRVFNSSGNDIIFTTDSSCGVKLTWEMEKYSATTGEFEAWVTNTGTPLSHTVDTTFYICYGNPTVSTFQSTASSVWDSNYKGVWHLPNGTTLSALDSTTNANNGSLSGTAPTATTGQIDGAANFGGSSFINNGSGASLYSASVTAEAWVKYTANTTFSSVVSEFDSGGTTTARNWALGIGSTTVHRWSVECAGTQFNSVSVSSVSTGTWYHIVGVFDGSTKISTLYVNGTAQTPVSTATAIQQGSDPLYLGSRADAGSATNGIIDEARYSNIARSADWITTEYNSENSPSTFYTVGSEIYTVPIIDTDQLNQAAFGQALLGHS